MHIGMIVGIRRAAADFHCWKTLAIAGSRADTLDLTVAIMRGGTDLGIAFEGRNAGFPIFDCAAIHAADIARTGLN